MDAGRRAAELCLRDAWPASESEEHRGWLLRATGGGDNRTNSVWPGAFLPDGSLDEAIGQAEAFYHRHNLTPRFQMIEGAAPDGLDAVLAARGYARQTPCTVLAKPVASVPMPPEVLFSTFPTPGWLDMYIAHQTPAKAAECRYIIVRVPASRAFLLLREEGQPVSLALAVRRGSDVAVEGILTRRDRRRSGRARIVATAAEAWASGQGANRLLVALDDDNEAAVGLFTALGYAPLSAYHYRALTRG